MASQPPRTRTVRGQTFQEVAPGQWAPVGGAAPAAPAPAASPYVVPPNPNRVARERLEAANIESTIADRAADNDLRREQIGIARETAESLREERQERRELRTTRRPLTPNVANPITQGVTGLVDYERLLGRFQDTFAGPGSGWENTFQSWLGTGTEGQRQWWADMAAMDNQLRNALFGASLTEGEKRAWENTTVNPNMTPAEVRRNLGERREIARTALGRTARQRAAMGYDRDAIREVLEQYGDLMDEEPGGQPRVSTSGEPGEREIGFNVPLAQRLGLSPTNEGMRLSPEQEQELAQFAQSRPTAEQLDAWFRERGFGGLGNAEEVARAIQNGQMPSGVNYNRVDRAARESGELDVSLNGVRLSDVAGTLGSLASDPVGTIPTLLYGGPDAAAARFRGRMDTMTLGFGDELGAAVATPFTDRTYADNLSGQRVVAENDSTNNPLARLQGQVEGGFALPVGQPSSAARLGLIGAGYGGAYGFGSTEGGIPERLIAAGEQAIVGGAAGYALGRAGQFVGDRATARAASRDAAGRSPSDGPSPADLIAAAERQRVDLLPADVGGTATRRLTAGAVQTPFGAPPVVRAANRTSDQVAARVGEIAAAEGAPARQEALGETAEAALRRFNENSAEEGRATYAAAREMADDRLYQGPQASRFLNREIRDLTIGPGATESTSSDLISGLTRLRNDIYNERGGRALDIDAIRRLRTNVRAEAQSEGLRATDYQRRAGEALDLLSDDIARQLPPDAAAEFRRADAAWRERLDFIDDVETRILGPKGDRSAEQVARRLQEMSRGDSARLGRVLDQVDPNEAGIIRGSLIQELGRARAGAQNAEGSRFSLETFLTNWDALPERTRNLLFRGESRAAIDDLAMIASGRRETMKFANVSNTAGGLNGSRSFVAQIVNFVPEHLQGRLLASARFARFLANPPRERGRMLRRLGRIAAQEPAIAPEINLIRTTLEGGARSAAAEGTEDSR